MAVLFACSGAVNAQVSSYTFERTTGSFTPLTGGTVLGAVTSATGAGSLYNVSYPVVMPFTFNFNGEIYNNLTVSTNGYITFGVNDGSVTSSPVSSTSDWHGAVSAWGRSLNSVYNVNNTTGNIKWDVVGTAPKREMVIQWSNFRPIYSVSTTEVYAFSFQIRLKETTNQVVTTYGSGTPLLGTSTITGTAQMGLRSKNTSDFNNRLNSNTLAFVNSTPGVSVSSTQYFSTSSTAVSGMPPAGFTYTWTPQTCFAASLTTGTSTMNSITANWAAPIPAPAAYDVYHSTSNAAPTNTTVPTQTNISGTSVTINSLANVTPYYV